MTRSTPSPAGWAVSSLWTAEAEDRLQVAVAAAEERVADLRRTLEGCRALRAVLKPLPAERWAFASPAVIAKLLADHPDGLSTKEIRLRLARSHLTVRQAIARNPRRFVRNADGRWTLRPQATNAQVEQQKEGMTT